MLAYAALEQCCAGILEWCCAVLVSQAPNAPDTRDALLGMQFVALHHAMLKLAPGISKVCPSQRPTQHAPRAILISDPLANTLLAQMCARQLACAWLEMRTQIAIALLPVPAAICSGQYPRHQRPSTHGEALSGTPERSAAIGHSHSGRAHIGSN